MMNQPSDALRDGQRVRAAPGSRSDQGDRQREQQVQVATSRLPR